MVFLLIFKRRERADKREESFCSEMSLGQAGYGEAKPGLLFSSKLPCFCSPLYRNTSHPRLGRHCCPLHSQRRQVAGRL